MEKWEKIEVYTLLVTILAAGIISILDLFGVLAFFDRQYIRSGVFPKDLSKQLHLAFERRQAQDYGEFTLIDEAIAQETLSNATRFVDVIDTYLTSAVFPELNP